MKNKLLWSPDKDKINNSNIKRFAQTIEQKFNINFKSNFKKFYEWSINQNKEFWSETWDFVKIIGSKGKNVIDNNDVFYRTKFFSDSKINFAENLLAKNNDDLAIFSLKENGLKDKISWNELNSKVCKLSSYFKTLNVRKGDRVAAYVPNTIETAVSFLATVKNGSIWSSCSPDFGIQGVVDRFKQIEPKILVTCDHYFYNGKKINILERIPKILNEISSITEVVVFSYDTKKKTNHNFYDFDQIINEAK